MLFQILLILRLLRRYSCYMSPRSQQIIWILQADQGTEISSSTCTCRRRETTNFPQLPKLTRDTIHVDVNPPGILAADFPVEMYAPNHERNNEDSEKACLRNGNICINMPRGMTSRYTYKKRPHATWPHTKNVCAAVHTKYSSTLFALDVDVDLPPPEPLTGSVCLALGNIRFRGSSCIF